MSQKPRLEIQTVYALWALVAAIVMVVSTGAVAFQQGQETADLAAQNDKRLDVMEARMERLETSIEATMVWQERIEAKLDRLIERR